MTECPPPSALATALHCLSTPVCRVLSGLSIYLLTPFVGMGRVQLGHVAKGKKGHIVRLSALCPSCLAHALRTTPGSKRAHYPLMTKAKRGRHTAGYNCSLTDCTCMLPGAHNSCPEDILPDRYQYVATVLTC